MGMLLSLLVATRMSGSCFHVPHSVAMIAKAYEFIKMTSFFSMMSIGGMVDL